MQLNATQTRLAMVFIALFAVGLGYFIWTRSAVPEPTVPPGQSIENPFGVPDGPSGRPVAGGPGGGTPGGGAGTLPPQTGTFDPKQGPGPSGGFPRNR